METYYGQVRTPHDAIILFEACRMGMLPRVQRRLSEKERHAIRSGSVFVWDEREAGMRRWTDGKSWSASRVSGSFLTYREMEGKRGSSGIAPPTKTPDAGRNNADDGADGDEGPDGYRYKPDGLMKQSFSITTSANQHLHLISYFSRAHLNSPGFPQPSTDPNLRTVRPAKGLYPESTVHDQQHTPAATKSPRAGASPHTVPSPSSAAYPPPAANSPHGVGYSPHSHTFPIQPVPNRNGPGIHPYAKDYASPPNNQPRLSPRHSSHRPIAAYHPPANSLEHRPLRPEETSNANLAPPPPPPPQQQEQQRQLNPGEPPPNPSGNSLLLQPPGNQPPPPPAAPIDPRLTADGSLVAVPVTSANGMASSAYQPPSMEGREAQTDPAVAAAVANPRIPTGQAPKTDAPLHITSAEDAVANKTAAPAAVKSADRPASMSPGSTTKAVVDGPADVPSQKFAFEEDQRALKALDKVFI